MRGLSPEVFEARRERVMEAIGEGAVAVVVGAGEKQRSNDTNYPYRASSDVIYLTGFEEPKTVVVLAPGHEGGEVVMFVPGRDEKYERWEGRRQGPEGAVENYGADAAYALDDLDEELPRFLEGRQRLYYTLGSNGDFDERVIRWVQELRHARNKAPKAPGEIADLRDLLHGLRVHKTAEEMALMRRACEISSEAHVLAMKHCRPGMHEYELQALVEYHFRRSGGDFPAYASIVGAGDNATILHYTDNRDRIEAGDVVLIDAGAEYQFYAGDITRSFPADGRFRPAQRDLYEAVLEVQEEVVAAIEPGVTYESLQEMSRRGLSEALVDLGLLEGDGETVYEEELYKDYYPHSIGHSLGMDVHDVGLIPKEVEADRPLEEGMVLTIEPGLYVPASDEEAPEAFRGVGIRIEDDILVTAGGHENLTADCPKSVDAIEALVGSGAEEALTL